MSKFISLFLAFGFSSLALAQSPVGRWKTIDDETKQPKSVVEVSEVDGKLIGKITELFRKADEEQNPLCDKCPDDKKNQPIKGLTIMWDLKKDGDEWTGGHILDPKNGKVYKCKIKLSEGGAKLVVRGFIGFSLIGRSQTWEKQN